MKVMVDFCVVPIGVGVSVSKYVAECQRVLSELDIAQQRVRTALPSTANGKVDRFDAAEAWPKVWHLVVSANHTGV